MKDGRANHLLIKQPTQMKTSKPQEK